MLSLTLNLDSTTYLRMHKIPTVRIKISQWIQLHTWFFGTVKIDLKL